MGRLTLTIRNGEYIVIDNKIQVTVHKTDDGVPKLVIEAPKEVKILREETLSVEDIAICRENGLSLA